MPTFKHAHAFRSLTPEQLVAVDAARKLIDSWKISATELTRAGVVSRHVPVKKTSQVHAPKRTPQSQLTPELKSILSQCRQFANFWAITAADLFAAKAPERSRVAIEGTQLIRGSAESIFSTCARSSYRHPITQEVWDGRGSQPEWLKRALTREGYTVRELLKSD